MSFTRFLQSRLNLQTRPILGAFLLVALLIVACSAEPTPTPTPTPEPTPTPTPLPTPTPTPDPTATPLPAHVPGSSRESFVPEGATLIIDADLSVILDSPVLAPLLETMLGVGGTEESVFDEFESETGISLRSIENAELYVDIEALFEAGADMGSMEEVEPPTLGVVLRGDLDEAEFLANLEAAMAEDPSQEYDVDTHRGYDMYVDANGDADNFSFAFEDADTLLFGTTDALRAMLDVAAGAASPVSGEGVAALDAMGERDFGMVLIAPTEALEAATAEGEGNMGFLGTFGPVALSAPLSVTRILLDDSSMQIQSKQFFEDEADADAYKEYNEGIMALMGAMSGSTEIQSLIAGAEVTQDGLEVSFDLNIDAALITAILDFLSMMMQAGSS